MNRCHSIVILLIIAILCLTAQVTADTEFILEIPDEVVLTGLKFNLSDLGHIRGGTEDDRRLLETISLGSVPPPGKVRVLNRSYLQFILRRHAFTEPPVLQMGKQVIVRADAYCLEPAVMEAAIRNLVDQSNIAGVERWVEFHKMPETLWLPQGDWKIKAETIGQLPLTGKALFKITVTQGDITKDINISGEIHAKAAVYRAVRDLPTHTTLKPEDFLREKVELTGREYVERLPEQVRSTTVIHKGTVLTEKHFEKIPLVHKGSEVTVIVKNVGCEIRLTGIARTDGWLDQKIVIINPVSKKSFSGIVTGMGTVEVTVK